MAWLTNSVIASASEGLALATLKVSVESLASSCVYRLPSSFYLLTGFIQISGCIDDHVGLLQLRLGRQLRLDSVPGFRFGEVAPFPDAPEHRGLRRGGDPYLIGLSLPVGLQQGRRFEAEGADILDVNVGAAGVDEVALLPKAVKVVMEAVDVPLCIDSANPDALKAALEVYQGKPIVNSVNGEEASLERILPLVKQYSAAVIGLCMDDEGIPTTAERRFAVAGRIIERAGKLGISPEDIAIDPLALTLGADHRAAKITLDAIEMIVAEFGVNITMGASNISFGMPDRSAINAAFIVMAIHAGMTCPIVNPLHEQVATAILAADLSMGRDEWGSRWIKAYRRRSRD